MLDSLFLISGDGKLKNMQSAAFESESIFQELLERFPSLLTNSNFGATTPRRWTIVRRESGISDGAIAGRWSADHLFLDQDAVVTIVEVKRASDTRIRREVVAQLIEYAANASIWWKAEAIAKWFEETSRVAGLEPETLLERDIGVLPENFEAFWRTVEANLIAGRMRLLVVADEIPSELSTIIEFLNEQMQSTIFMGLELRRFVDGDDFILVPRVIGATSRAQGQKSVISSRLAYPASVAEWLTENDVTNSVKELLAGLEAQGVSPVVADRALALDLGGRRFGYIRKDRFSIALWQLAKETQFADESTQDALRCLFKDRGFKPSTETKNGEPSFVIPLIDDSEKWNAFNAAVADLVGRLKR